MPIDERRTVIPLRPWRNCGNEHSGASDAPLCSADQLTEVNRALVSMDRMISPAMGRPCSIQDEEYEPFMFS